MNGSYGASLVIRAIGTWAIFQSLAISLGGPDRWANPAYDVANLMPGSPYTWAVILLIGGALIMYGSLTNGHLPFKNFTYKQITFDGRLRYKNVTVDWNSQQIRNVGLKIVGCWLLLFGFAFIAMIMQLPDIGFGAGSRDVLLSVICMIMTKVQEPKRGLE